MTTATSTERERQKSNRLIKQKKTTFHVHQGRMLLQSVAIGTKKLLVDDNITAFVKEICLLGVVCKVSNRKTLSGETFCFPEKRLLSLLNFVLRVTYFFCELLIGRQPTFLK